MFDSLIDAMRPWFPNPLWTLNRIQVRHLKTMSREVEWSEECTWLSQRLGLALCDAQHLYPGMPFWSPQWGFGAGRKELGHLLNSPEFLTT